MHSLFQPIFYLYMLIQMAKTLSTTSTDANNNFKTYRENLMCIPFIFNIHFYIYFTYEKCNI
jgi:hypothetical protein